jgi:PadR family transcriptional regulator PadR
MDPVVLPRDHFRASLLLVLAEAPVHGYDVHALLTPLGHGQADRGFVYRTLRAMEGEGLIVSAWVPSPVGPARRTYQVTATGRHWMASASASLREADRHVAGWLSRYRAVVRGGGLRSVPRVPAAS